MLAWNEWKGDKIRPSKHTFAVKCHKLNIEDNSNGLFRDIQIVTLYLIIVGLSLSQTPPEKRENNNIKPNPVNKGGFCEVSTDTLTKGLDVPLVYDDKVR